MYKYNKDIENIKKKIVDNKEISLYPQYILSDENIYYDKAKSYEECMINIFIMNIINGILREGWIEDINKYLIDNDKNILNLEKQIYNSIYHFLITSYNPRKAIISLLKLLNYEVKETKEYDKDHNRIHFQINDSKKLANLMVTLFSNEKIDLPNKSITTSKDNIYENFYNYMIMDYKIERYPKIEFTGKEFITYPKMKEDISDNEEKLKKEIELIKKYPINERNKFLKN